MAFLQDLLQRFLLGKALEIVVAPLTPSRMFRYKTPSRVDLAFHGGIPMIEELLYLGFTGFQRSQVFYEVVSQPILVQLVVQSERRVLVLYFVHKGRGGHKVNRRQGEWRSAHNHTLQHTQGKRTSPAQLRRPVVDTLWHVGPVPDEGRGAVINGGVIGSRSHRPRSAVTGLIAHGIPPLMVLLPEALRQRPWGL